MPYNYHIDSDLEAGFIRMTGYVDADQIVSAGHAVYSSLEWRTSYNSLWDFRSSHTVDITEEGFREIIRQKLNRDQESGGNEKIALVIDRDNLISVAELAQIKASTPSREIRFFSRKGRLSSG